MALIDASRAPRGGDDLLTLLPLLVALFVVTLILMAIAYVLILLMKERFWFSGGTPPGTIHGDSHGQSPPEPTPYRPASERRDRAPDTLPAYEQPAQLDPPWPPDKLESPPQRPRRELERPPGPPASARVVPPAPAPPASPAPPAPLRHPLAGRPGAIPALVHAELAPRGIVRLGAGLWPAIWQGASHQAPRRGDRVLVRVPDLDEAELVAVPDGEETSLPPARQGDEW